MLKTDRLMIRRFDVNDWEDVYDYLSDEEVVRYEPYPPLKAEECRQYVDDYAASKNFWAVCLKDTGLVIGQVYLAEGQQQNWELGYVFHKKHQHLGYATEAVKALLDYVFSQCGAYRITASCNPENAPSWQLLNRLGFRREGHLIKNVYFHTDVHKNPLWQDTYQYGLLAEEWGMQASSDRLY